MHPAALPGRAQELLPDRLDEATMVVADDQPPSSLPGASSSPRMRRSPVTATPVATSAASRPRGP